MTTPEELEEQMRELQAAREVVDVARTYARWDIRGPIDEALDHYDAATEGRAAADDAKG
jgi:hypothetical protein